MPVQMKSIPISGLSTSPSDYTVTDGHLAAAINCVHEDAAIKNYIHTAPKILLDLSAAKFCPPSPSAQPIPIDDAKVIYMHQNSDIFRHIIIHGMFGGDHIYFYEDVTEGFPSEVSTSTNATNHFAELYGKQVSNVIAVGNMLIFSAESKMYYYLYKDGQYAYMGSRLPELDMAFGLNGHIAATRLSNGNKVEIDNLKKIEQEDINVMTPFDGYGVGEDLINYATSEANLFTDETARMGYFTQPFLVRYAYELYDGSTAMASAPVLMIPTSGFNPRIHVARSITDSGNTYILAKGVACQLRYILPSMSELSAWRDIIKSVNIYVSAPFYTYNQDSNTFRGATIFPTTVQIPAYFASTQNVFQSADEGDTLRFDLDARKALKASVDPTDQSASVVESVSLARHPDGSYYDDNGSLVIGSGESISGWNFPEWWRCDALHIKLDYYDHNHTEKQIKDCGTFYLLKSYNLEELETSADGVVIDIDDDYLNNITQHPVLTDDYDSHHDIFAGILSSYNNRLTMAGVEKGYFKGFSPFSMLQRTYSPVITEATGRFLAVTYIRDMKGDIVVCSLSNELFNTYHLPAYVYYPDPNAYKMEIYVEGEEPNTVFRYNFHLHEHPALNGAFALGGFYTQGTPSPEETRYETLEEVIVKKTSASNRAASIHNEIRTSEPNNPFVFLASNVESIGNGAVIALVPQAVAMSQGQFGQYPMMCFTTEGVWALSVSDTGGYKAKQPFSRDVVLNHDPSNILQLDREVMFATDRGLMIIAGSNVDCISEVFDGEPDSLLPDLFSVAPALDFNGNIIKTDIPVTDRMFMPFREFIKRCNFHYDYTHQRIVIGRDDLTVCYVYSKKDRLWTQAFLHLTSHINSYPNAYAMAKDHEGHNLLIDLADDPSSEHPSQSAPASDYSPASADAPASVPSSPVMPSSAFILTRPITITEGSELKTISNTILRGHFDRRNASIVLFASRDLFHWHIIGSSPRAYLHHLHGTPYRYFRIAVISNLAAGESISSIDVEYEVKQSNKLR